MIIAFPLRQLDRAKWRVFSWDLLRLMERRKEKSVRYTTSIFALTECYRGSLSNWEIWSGIFGGWWSFITDTGMDRNVTRRLQGKPSGIIWVRQAFLMSRAEMT